MTYVVQECRRDPVSYLLLPVRIIATFDCHRAAIAAARAYRKTAPQSRVQVRIEDD